MLEILVFLCQTFGSESLTTGCHVPSESLCPTVFAVCIHSGRYGRGKKYIIGTVSVALSAIGTAVALAYEGILTKAQGNKYLLPRMAQTMEEWRKEDTPTKKNIPVGIGVPEFLVELGMAKDATEVVKVVGDCAVIAFYYLLRVEEYTMKGQRNETNQTVQLKLEYAMLFRRYAKGRLRQLPINALGEEILYADGATLKLHN